MHTCIILSCNFTSPLRNHKLHIDRSFMILHHVGPLQSNTAPKTTLIQWPFWKCLCIGDWFCVCLFCAFLDKKLLILPHFSLPLFVCKILTTIFLKKWQQAMVCRYYVGYPPFLCAETSQWWCHAPLVWKHAETWQGFGGSQQKGNLQKAGVGACCFGWMGKKKHKLLLQ